MHSKLSVCVCCMNSYANNQQGELAAWNSKPPPPLPQIQLHVPRYTHSVQMQTLQNSDHHATHNVY